MSEGSLIEFQDALNELLMSGRSEDSILEILKTAERFEDYREYVLSFDVDMISVAVELVSKWSRRKSNER